MNYVVANNFDFDLLSCATDTFRYPTRLRFKIHGEFLKHTFLIYIQTLVRILSSIKIIGGDLNNNRF